MSVNQVSIVSAPGVDPNLSPETGLTVRYARGGSATLAMTGGRISGFRTGVWLDQGARADLSQVQVLGARIGLVSRAIDLTLSGSELDVENTGVYLVMGHAKIIHNTIYGFDGAPIVKERDADVFVDDNWIYPRQDCHGYREYRRTCGRYDDRPARFRDHGAPGPSERGGRDEDRGPSYGSRLGPPPPPPPDSRR
jgi:hypothetical protein